jgi:hypothetical protein
MYLYLEENTLEMLLEKNSNESIYKIVESVMRVQVATFAEYFIWSQ